MLTGPSSGPSSTPGQRVGQGSSAVAPRQGGTSLSIPVPSPVLTGGSTRLMGSVPPPVPDSGPVSADSVVSVSATDRSSAAQTPLPPPAAGESRVPPIATPDLTAAHRVLDSLDAQHDAEHDLAFSDASVPKQNTGVQYGILTSHLAMWSWACLVVLATTWSKAVFSIVEHGYRFRFNELGPPKPAFRRNYFNRDTPASTLQWVEKQFDIMESFGCVKFFDTDHIPDDLLILPLFTVPKGSDGKGLRLIIDASSLNRHLNTKKFKLPTLDKLRWRLNEAHYMLCFDFSSAYHHIQIHEDFQKYLAFRTPNGRVGVLKVLPFGLSTAPYIFQQAARATWEIANKVGLSDLLVTPSDWARFATLSQEDQLEMVPLNRRVQLDPAIYLDDCCMDLPLRVENASGRLLSEQETAAIAPALAQSAMAMAKAFGWSISEEKCFMDPSLREVKYLGWDCILADSPHEQNMFRIPVTKLERIRSSFARFGAATLWTLLDIAKFCGLVMSLRLLWGQLAFQIARPLFHHLAEAAKRSQSCMVRWSDTVSPSDHDLDCVRRALRCISPGSGQFIYGPMVTKCMDILRDFSENPSNLDHLDKIATDASDRAMGGFMATGLSIPEFFKCTYETLIRNPKFVAMWKLLEPASLPESSMFRELDAVLAYYNPTRVARLLRVNAGLVHFLDAKAAVHALTKGCSSSPGCNNLISKILDATHDLIVRRGLCWIHVLRDRNVCADDLTKKTIDFQIRTPVFDLLHKLLRFTLDAFASPSDVVRPTEGPPLRFCSRFESDAPSVLNLGNAQFVNWSGERVWAFPPPKIPAIVAIAINKCEMHSGVAVLCLPVWRDPSWKTRIANSSWVATLRLPAASAHIRSIVGGQRQGHKPRLAYSNLTAPLQLYIYNSDPSFSPTLESLLAPAFLASVTATISATDRDP